MNNYLDAARDIYRSIPFITPALKIDLQGNYECEIDFRIANNRAKFFTVLCGGSLASLAVLKFSSITILAGFATPLAIAVGIVAIGVLGVLIDDDLNYRARNRLAFELCLKSEEPPTLAVAWLLYDLKKFELLIKNFDTDKKESFVRKLIEIDYRDNNRTTRSVYRAGFWGNNKLFLLFWNQASDKIKIDTFFNLLPNLDYESNNSKKNLDSIIDNKMISSDMVLKYQTDIDQGFNYLFTFATGSFLKYLEKATKIGFNVRAKDQDGKAIRDRLIDQIESSTDLGKKDNLIKTLEVVEKIIKKQNITTGIVLKQGQFSEESNFKMFPDDILNHIFNAMVITH